MEPSDGAPQPIYCPRCGRQRVGWDINGHAVLAEQDTATTLREEGELAADVDCRLPESDHFTGVHVSGSVLTA